MKSGAFIFLLAGSLLGLCLCLEAAEPAPASAPAGKADIEAISEAKDIAAATGALAEAQKLDPDNPKALDAYLRRAIALGRPQKAFAAAEQLARLQGENALAQGLLGYCLAMRGSFMEASAATVKAAAVAPENSGVMFNIGVLTKWREVDPTHAMIPPAAVDTLHSNLARWSSRSGFSEGSDSADKALAQRAVRVEQVRQRLEPAQKKVEELTKPIPAPAGRGRKAKAAPVDPAEALKAKAQKEKQAAEKQMAAAVAAIQKIRASTPNNADKKTVDKAVTAIAKNQQAYVQAQVTRAEAIRRVKAAEEAIATKDAPLKNAKAAVESIQKEMDRVATATPLFDWRPPTIDGQAFVDKDSRLAPVAGDGEGAPASDASKLEVAKALIQNNRPQPAIKILGEIIDHDPNSDAAKEAQKLMDQIAKQRSP
ncbi:MAG: hypothetical protein LLG01_02030 [Planctomycetaceae bacterium]|nr:hypothetical protein [Planctomycetaceae bacterium]